MLTRLTGFGREHFKTILLWIAIWAIVVIGFRVLAWGIGFACEETVCKII
ncbi:MAG: hypothetical protein Q4E62_03495 [Sutterellaceae bacterium]|nr:hypothetical protein [Sutterellaceae bacterium]